MIDNKEKERERRKGANPPTTMGQRDRDGPEPSTTSHTTAMASSCMHSPQEFVHHKIIVLM